MPFAPAESRPSPWLNLLLTVGITASGVVYSAATRDADVRHVVETNAAQDKRLEALEARANGSDVTLAGFKVELAYIRAGVDDLRNLLRGGTARR